MSESGIVGMKSGVFISHHSGEISAAETLAAELEKRGVETWYAPRDIPPGSSWDEEIGTAISNARVMVVLFGIDSDSSRYVKRELMLADQHGVPIIPVRIEDVRPIRLALLLAATQWVDWPGCDVGQISHLTDAVGRYITPIEPSEPEIPGPVLPSIPSNPARVTTLIKMARERAFVVHLGASEPVERRLRISDIGESVEGEQSPEWHIRVDVKGHDHILIEVGPYRLYAMPTMIRSWMSGIESGPYGEQPFHVFSVCDRITRSALRGRWVLIRDGGFGAVLNITEATRGTYREVEGGYRAGTVKVNKATIDRGEISLTLTLTPTDAQRSPAVVFTAQQRTGGPFLVGDGFLLAALN